MSRSGHQGEWVSVFRYADLISRPRRTVYKWLYNGTLHAFHVPVHRDERGKWWIQITY